MRRFPNFNRRQTLGFGLGSLASLGLPRMAGAQGNGSVRVRVNADLSNLDPMSYTGTEIEEAILNACLPRLTTFVGNGTTEWEHYAAASIDKLNDTTYRFNLRPGLMWTDGFGPLTSRDVKYSFERVANPDNNSPWAGYFVALDRVEPIDDLTGDIILKEPFAPLYTISLPAFAGNIVCAKAVEAAGGTFSTALPAQCGPYRMVEWLPRQKVVLERNPDWTLFPVDFERIEMVIQSDSLLGEISYEAGELDYTQLSANSTPRFKAEPPPGSAVHSHDTTAYYWLGMNVEHPNLSDLRFRRAIQHAVDRDEIIQSAFSGLYPAAAGIIPPILVGHRKANSIAFDPERAKALLAEIGTVPNLTIAVLPDTEQAAVAQIIASQLGRVGITVEVIVHDPATFWTLGIEESGTAWKDLQLVYMGFNGSFDPGDDTVWFTSDQIGVWNWQRISTPEFDALHAKALRESDLVRRGELYVKMQDIMEETGAYVFINFATFTAVHRDWLKPATRPDFYPAFDKFRLS
jgi:peptide/nickel transport system substrate-binding protein